MGIVVEFFNLKFPSVVPLVVNLGYLLPPPVYFIRSESIPNNGTIALTSPAIYCAKSKFPLKDHTDALFLTLDDQGSVSKVQNSANSSNSFFFSNFKYISSGWIILYLVCWFVIGSIFFRWLFLPKLLKCYLWFILLPFFFFFHFILFLFAQISPPVVPSREWVKWYPILNLLWHLSQKASWRLSIPPCSQVLSFF